MGETVARETIAEDLLEGRYGGLRGEGKYVASGEGTH